MTTKILEPIEVSNLREGLAIAYGHLGCLYQTRGALQKAEEMFNKSLNLFSDLGSPNQKLVENLLDNLNRRID